MLRFVIKNLQRNDSRSLCPLIINNGYSVDLRFTITHAQFTLPDTPIHNKNNYTHSVLFASLLIESADYFKVKNLLLSGNKVVLST